MSKQVRRRGFTLPEVLVTITIVAVLAAVVVPAVLNQVSKGDDSAVAQDLVGVRTAITAFTSDVRKFPGNLKHLSGTSLFADSIDVTGAQYGASSAAAYGGPYMNISGATHVGPSGAIFKARMTDTLSQVCLRDSVVTATSMSLISLAQAAQMDKALDRQDGSTAGSVRWIAAGTTPDSVEANSFYACLVTR